MKYKIAELSSWNRGINWDIFQKEQIDGAIIRATIGHKTAGFVDRKFEEYYKELKEKEKIVSAYHYSYAQTKEEAEEEADFFLETIKDKNFDFPVALIIDNENIDIYNNRIIIDIISSWSNRIIAAGYPIIIYIDINYIKKYNLDIINDYNLWLSDEYDDLEGMITYFNEIEDSNPIIINELIIRNKNNSLIEVGDYVKIAKDATTYSGKKLNSLIDCNKIYTVDELVKDRAILNKNGICTAFNVKDLIKQ